MRAVRMDFYGYDNGVVDVDQLPLSEEDKQVVATVQRQGATLARYLKEHRGGHELVEVTGFPDCEGCLVDLRTATVYKPNGEQRRFYPTKTGYLQDSEGNYLHRIVAYTYTRETNKSLWERAMAFPDQYQVHHKRPELKGVQYGNGITNVVLLPEGLHKRYTTITRRLRAAVEYDHENVELVKPFFYEVL